MHKYGKRDSTLLLQAGLKPNIAMHKLALAQIFRENPALVGWVATQHRHAQASTGMHENRCECAHGIVGFQPNLQKRVPPQQHCHALPEALI